MSGPLGINLAMRSTPFLDQGAYIPIGEDVFEELPPDEPVTTLPGWEVITDPENPDTEPPGLPVGDGSGLVTDGTGGNDVVIGGPNPGSQARIILVTLSQILLAVGGPAIFIKDWQNYVFIQYNPDNGKIEIISIINGEETVLADWTVSIGPGSQIGVVVSGGFIYLLADGVRNPGSPPAVPDTFGNDRSGLVVRAPAGGIFISRYSWSTIARGYGRRYGLNYGN